MLGRYSPTHTLFFPKMLHTLPSMDYVCLVPFTHHLLLWPLIKKKLPSFKALGSQGLLPSPRNRMDY